MKDDFIYQHILGSLANAFIGDAMGSATEAMTPDEINAKFGGKVTKFITPPAGTFASGRNAGQLTDDTTQMLQMIQALIENKGKISVELVADRLLKWAESDDLFERFAGPTTRKAILLMRDGKSPYETGKPSTMDMGVSNGAAMKVSGVGLIHPGDLDAAVRDAATMCVPTHNSDVAYAGASATAAAVAAGLVPDATPLTIVDAALYGAQKGYEIGKKESVVLRCPSMVERIKLAVEIAVSETDFDKACNSLADVIGCGLPILEAVPFAVGVFVASRGDPNLAVIGAVNMGGDADTTATITGAISGAYAGFNQIDQSLYKQMLNANSLDIDDLVEKLVNLVSSK
jgi:ADP-ribosylglycohydrolase